MIRINSKTLASMLLLFISFIAMIGDSQAKDCAMRPLGSVDLLSDGALLVPMTMQGKSVLMYLHTGVAMSYFFEPAVAELGLRRRGLNSYLKVTNGNVKMTDVAEFDSFDIGGNAFGKSNFLIRPFSESLPHVNNLPVVGALGLNVFSHVDFELDLAHKKLKIFSQDHCKGKVVYWTKNYSSTKMYRGQIGNLYFPMEVEGKKLQATIDTGSAISSVQADVTKTLFGFDENSEGTQKEANEPGSPDITFYRAMKITAPGLTLIDTKMRLAPAQNHCTSIIDWKGGRGIGYYDCPGLYPLLLGRNVLENLRLYFATAENMVYFSNADAAD